MEFFLLLLVIPVVWTYSGSGIGSFSFPKGLFLKLFLASIALSLLLSLIANISLERRQPHSLPARSGQPVPDPVYSPAAPASNPYPYY